MSLAARLPVDRSVRPSLGGFPPMGKYTVLRLSLGVAAIALAACGKTDQAGDTAALKTDSSLSKDLKLAGQDTAAKPQLKDVGPAAAPAATPTKSKAAAPKKATTTASGKTKAAPAPAA